MSGKPGRSGTNKNQDKPFRDALLIEINDAVEGGHKACRRLARTLVERGLTGDVAAIREIADRTDGKPSQDLAIKQDVSAEFLSALRMIAALRTKDYVPPLGGESNKITDGTITIDCVAGVDAGVDQVCN